MAAGGPDDLARDRAAMAPACAGCGVPAPGDPPPPTWSAGVERGRAQHLCADCTRRSVRGIEARLDPQWW